MLLFCAWTGAVKKKALTAADFRSLQDAVGAWHQTAVRPLRAVRETVKALPEMAHDEVQALRKQVAASELRAEQIEQALLHGWAEGQPTRETDASLHDLVRGNVQAFLENHRQGQGPADAAPTSAFIDAVLRAAGQ